MKNFFDRIVRFFDKPLPFIGLLIVLATSLRSLFMTKAAIWHDEGYSTAIINYPLGEIITRTINDVHPPFYYILLHIWQSIFGSSIVSLRGLSVVLGVMTIVVLYLLMRRLFSEKVAKLTGIFAAFGPFLIRYSDEVRMYALAALLAVLATYLLVIAISKTTKQRYWWWGGYALIIALGLYTQYFFIFIIPAHIIYTLAIHKWQIKRLLADKGWWLGNLLAAGMFLPWLPVMLAQTSRVQQGFWIPPVNLGSIPNTISNFMTYDNTIAILFGYCLLVAIVIVPLIFALKSKKYLESTLLLVGWLILPIIFVALLSLGRPVYIDRYFTYSAPAFYALIALTISSIRTKKWKWIQPTLIVLTLATFTIGLVNVAAAATHQMNRVVNVVNREFRPGDTIVSAELYTFFDFSYYNQTGAEVKLLSSKPFGKYGEMSLLYDKPHLRVASLSDINSERVWLVGKTGEHSYFSEEIPANWRLISQTEASDSAARLYEITPAL